MLRATAAAAAEDSALDIDFSAEVERLSACGGEEMLTALDTYVAKQDARGRPKRRAATRAEERMGAQSRPEARGDDGNDGRKAPLGEAGPRKRARRAL